VALDTFAFLFTGRGLDPAVDRTIIGRDGFQAVMVGMADAAQAPACARKLVDEGVQLIELCGGFGPVWTAKVIEAVGDRVPVGSVGYGPESITAMARLFPED
jgi:predicted polyphosphate/ATP-dependent NAD kinase